MTTTSPDPSALGAFASPSALGAFASPSALGAFASPSALGAFASPSALGAFASVDQTDAGDFIGRLDRMSAFAAFQAYKQVTFSRMQLGQGMQVADVGSGAGEDARLLADLVGAGGKVSGIDLSTAMVDEASGRYAGIAGLGFLQGSAQDLPFADGTLDAIRADRVLIHVPDPAAALAEMIRVLRPGGRIVISEPDMPGFWIASDDAEFAGIVSAVIARSCANPHLPRHLRTMFQDLALDDIAYEAITITTDNLELVAGVVSLEQVLTGIGQLGLASPERVAAFRDEQAGRAQAGRFCAGLTMLMASATRGNDGSAGFMLNTP